MNRRDLLFAMAGGFSLVAGCTQGEQSPEEETTTEKQITRQTTTASSPSPVPDDSPESTDTDGQADQSVGATPVVRSTSDQMSLAVYPSEERRTFFDYEYVVLTNTGAQSFDLTGYTLAYGADRSHSYTFGNLTIKPDAQVVVSSRKGDDTILDREPPIYHRFADFGSGTDTSVLNNTGDTVRLLDADGETVVTATFGAAQSQPTDSA